MTSKIAMTIAGSDCSAGAGLQADLKTFSSFHVHGLTAVTCVVSETPLKVSKVHPVPPAILRDQVKLLLESYPIAAIKTGMLYSKAHIVTLCELLADLSIPIIIDPVMLASTGTPLLAEDAFEALVERLLPLASVITPNLPEAEVLIGQKITSHSDQLKAAHSLAEKYQSACYLKGGHFELNNYHQDILIHQKHIEVLAAPHLDLPHSHGTGCTLAAALSAGIANGLSIVEAAKRAHQFTHRALQNSFIWESSPKVPLLSHLNQIQPQHHSTPKLEK